MLRRSGHAGKKLINPQVIEDHDMHQNADAYTLLHIFQRAEKHDISVTEHTGGEDAEYHNDHICKVHQKLRKLTFFLYIANSKVFAECGCITI